MSDAWKHTLNKGKTVTCKLRGNTSRYSSYWNVVSPMESKRKQEKLTTKAATKSKKSKVSTFFQKRQIEKVISRLTTLDVFSFNDIVNNSFIRYLKKVMFFQKITNKQTSQLKSLQLA